MPLDGPPPSEVPLENAPLIRVIAQVRFPLIASIERRDYIGAFQEAIRGTYGVLRPEYARSFSIGPRGPMETRTSTIWRFQNGSDDWRVSLAPDFLALETTKYTSRQDLVERLEFVLRALAEHINPNNIDRLGVRYIDRVSGELLTDLPKLVRPEVAGILATPLARFAGHSITESVFKLPSIGGKVSTRWGLVPGEGTVDPGAIEPMPKESWLFDVDAFKQETQPLDVDTIVQQARSLAERVYSIFRWATNDEFLRRFGGKP